jgi:hypothetical protein
MTSYNDAIHRNPGSGLDENDVVNHDLTYLDLSP